MSTTYERAPNAIQAMVDRALEQYHPDLAKVHVSVDTIIVSRFDKIPGGEDGDTEAVHAMKRSGYPIDAKIGVTSLQDRARGIGDAKLMIDGLEWNKATDRQRAALIDHELEHLDLIPLKPTKKEPNRSGPKFDDLSRPCLRIRPHDWQLAGFKDVAERHGQHSHEALQFANFRAEYAQLNLFGAPDVLAIAQGNGKKAKRAKDAVRRLHATIARNGGGSISTTVDGKTETVKIAAARSSACRNRKHQRCIHEDCGCDCHNKGAEA